uniref:EF-hand domain-containing protein n=1 Tax=Glossina austeni TaxID=7395 RepID=A0A1A9VDG0_GLOAU
MDSLIPSIVIDHPNGSAMDACFTAFDKDGDGRLNLAEFTLICRALFRNDRGHIYDVPAERLEQIFSVFDTNDDGYIDRDEFKFCWNQWIKTTHARQQCDEQNHGNQFLNWKRTEDTYLKENAGWADHFSDENLKKVFSTVAKSFQDAGAKMMFGVVIYPTTRLRLRTTHKCLED